MIAFSGTTQGRSHQMEPPDIDYEALYKQVTKELELARLKLLLYRYGNRTLANFRLKDISRWIIENYTVIAGGSLLIVTALWLLSTMKDLFKE
jgi:hypothetical protein